MPGPWELFQQSSAPGQAGSGPWDLFATSAPDTSPNANVSRGEAALEGALAGASANLRDEIYGLSEASGLPHALGGFRAPIGAARLAYEAVTGQGEATGAYEHARDTMRARAAEARKDYPGTFLASEIAGGLLPAGAALKAVCRFPRGIDPSFSLRTDPGRFMV